MDYKLSLLLQIITKLTRQCFQYLINKGKDGQPVKMSCLYLQRNNTVSTEWFIALTSLCYWTHFVLCIKVPHVYSRCAILLNLSPSRNKCILPRTLSLYFRNIISKEPH